MEPWNNSNRPPVFHHSAVPRPHIFNQRPELHYNYPLCGAVQPPKPLFAMPPRFTAHTPSLRPPPPVHNPRFQHRPLHRPQGANFRQPYTKRKSSFNEYGGKRSRNESNEATSLDISGNPWENLLSDHEERLHHERLANKFPNGDHVTYDTTRAVHVRIYDVRANENPWEGLMTDEEEKEHHKRLADKFKILLCVNSKAINDTL